MSKNSQNKLPANPVVLITGGAGFLGRSIVAELFQESSKIQPKEVRVFDLKPYSGEHSDHIRFILGDIRDTGALKKAFRGVDLVIHSAAVIDWGVREESEVLGTNLDGTENVINACLDQGVHSLLFTSSLDAVYTGNPLVDIDEDQPYPSGSQNAYCRSKTLGEKLVLAAHGAQLKTCVLRPSDIYGEADPYHIEPLIEMSEKGFYIRLGDGSSKCQHVYVGNMAHAHILAGSALLSEDQRVGGRVYFITDGPGTNFFLFFDEIVRRAGYRIWPRNLWLPKSIAYTLATLTEFSAALIKPLRKIDVQFSRFAVAYTCNDFTFTSQRARDDFGYSPKYELEECLNRTAEYYRKK